MYAKAAIKPNTLIRNGAYGIVMRGVQKCTCAGASLRGRNSAPLCCINLDTATDPPYNTGNDFIYRDDFAVSADDYAEESGQLDDDGNRLFKNTDSNGRFHSDWCSMIYTRLMLARNLLKDDGVIFISIDDDEIRNLKNICDEIYGPYLSCCHGSLESFFENLACHLVCQKYLHLRIFLLKSNHYVLIYIRCSS